MRRSNASAGRALKTPSTRRRSARSGRCQDRAKNRNEAPQNAAKSMYSRASCEYQIMNGLNATNAAATSPAERETSWRPDRYAIGISARPGDRRQRADAGFGGSEHVRPRPGQDEEQRRIRFAWSDRAQHRSERHVELPGGERLVEPEALLPEGREPQDGSRDRQTAQQPRGRADLSKRRGHGAARCDRIVGPRREQHLSQCRSLSSAACHALPVNLDWSRCSHRCHCSSPPAARVIRLRRPCRRDTDSNRCSRRGFSSRAIRRVRWTRCGVSASPG